MLLIPVGLFFVMFYINVPIGGYTVDILPDAIGYILIAANMVKLKEYSYSFTGAMGLSIFLAVYSLFLRLTVPTGLIAVGFSVLELAAQLYLLRLLVNGVKDLESSVDTHLNSFLLDRWRQGVELSWVVSYICVIGNLFIPGIEFFGFLVAVIWAVLCALFIVVFLRTARRYRLLLQSKG